MDRDQAMDRCYEEEYGGIQMARPQFATIVHAFTKRTDIQTAPHAVNDGQILRFQLSCNDSRWGSMERMDHPLKHES